jgi:hypothetical protein
MRSKFIITWVSLMFLFNLGCKWEQMEKQLPIATVSFKDNVIPILNASCNTSSCHATGKVSPDLSPINAYNSLTYGGYITDSVNFTNNSLYQEIKSGKMPKGFSLSAHDTAVIYTWIRKGFRDN